MSATSKNNIDVSNTTEGSAQNSTVVSDATGGSTTTHTKIKVPEYIPGVNYFALFCESEEKLNKLDYQKYTVSEVWYHHKESSGKENDDRYYYCMYSRNLVLKYRQKNKTFSGDIEAMVKLNKTVEEDFPWAFITLNWNDSDFTIKQILTASKKIFDKPWCGPGSFFVVEKHRINGIHHHTHFLIKFACDKKSPSRIIDDIYALRSVKEICRDKHFIDYLGPQKSKKGYRPFEVYYDYVRGVKCEEKMPFVQLDRQWREENDIPHLFTK